MNDDPRRWLLLLLAGACAGYALLMAANPARPALRDGWRALRRYPALWLLPVMFVAAGAAFNIWVDYKLLRKMAPPWFAPWEGWQPPPWSEVLAASWLPTAGAVSGLFDCIVATFPISVLAAAAFLGNLGGWQGKLFGALRRRVGWQLGLAIHAALLVCAAAAVVKPLLFAVFCGALPMLTAYLSIPMFMRTQSIVCGLSFLFEYLLGVLLQVYLILLSYVWARGLTFDFTRLRHFALRRFVFAVKWAAVTSTVFSLGINLPIIAASFQPPMMHGGLPASVWITGWMLAAILLIFCSVQATLIFHNRPLLGALADQWRLWRRHGGFFAWFIAVAALHFFALALANAFLPSALGKWTWPGVVWAVAVYPALWGGLAGWLLASWAYLFRRCERNHRPAGAREEF